MSIAYSDFLSVLPKAQEHSHYLTGVCPFHDDTDPSLLVFDDGWFQCLGCGRHGRWETLWNRLKGQPVQIMPERRTFWGTPRLSPEQVEEVCYQGHEDLMRFPSLGWYLEMRGITSRIESNELGYWEGWYTIPVTDRDGNFVTGVLRAAPHVQRVTGERYWMRGAPAMYVPDWNLIERNGFLFVVYGMIDALVLASLRLPVVTSTAGQKKFDPEWLESYRKRIIIVPDQGEELSASALASRLGWRGKVKRLDYPYGIKDPAGFAEIGKANELLAALGKETA